MRRYRQKGGFTVLELVLLVAVIALLVAVIFPMVLPFAENGKNTDAMAKTKTLYNSIQATLVNMTDVTDIHFYTDTMEEHLALADEGEKTFLVQLDTYLPADYSGEFGFIVEGAVIKEVIWQNDERSCFYDMTGEYTITTFDDKEFQVFNSDQEFIAEGIEEGDLP